MDVKIVSLLSKISVTSEEFKFKQKITFSDDGEIDYKSMTQDDIAECKLGFEKRQEDKEVAFMKAESKLRDGELDAFMRLMSTTPHEKQVEYVYDILRKRQERNADFMETVTLPYCRLDMLLLVALLRRITYDNHLKNLEMERRSAEYFRKCQEEEDAKCIKDSSKDSSNNDDESAI